MNIQNINNRILINPSSIEDIEAVSHIAELRDYNDIIVDMIDLDRIEQDKPYSSCMSIIIGLLIDMMNKGKNVIIMHLHAGAFTLTGGVINYLNTLNV